MKTIGLYMANTFGITWNAKKDKEGKVVVASVTHDIPQDVLLERVSLNGHTWEDVGKDYALRKLERAVKGVKEGEGDKAVLVLTRDSSKKDVLAVLADISLEVRTPDVETISVAQFMEDNEDQLNALGIKEAQVRGFISLTMPNVVITD